MDRETKRMLDRIFSDAAVADIDLSEWDRGIAVYVFADHVEARTMGLLPFFCILFAKCKKFSCDYVYPIPELDDPKWHCQWHVHEITYPCYRKGAIAVELCGPRPSPSIKIECEDITISRIDSSSLDRLFGSWRGPYRPFVRLGIKALLREKEYRLKKKDEG